MDIFRVDTMAIVFVGLEQILRTFVPLLPLGEQTPGQILLFPSLFMLRAVHGNNFDVERFVVGTRDHRRTSTHQKIVDGEVTPWRDRTKEVARIASKQKDEPRITCSRHRTRTGQSKIAFESKKHRHIPVGSVYRPIANCTLVHINHTS